MKTVYTAVYRCKSKTSIGMPGYYNIVLGLAGANGSSDIIIKGTCSDFEVGVEYLVGIATK